MPLRSPFRRHVAVPSDHGSWVLLLSPLLIGLFAGGRWTTPSLYLVVAALAGFLARQPMTLAVKALSGRRSRDELGAAGFWIAVYGLVALVHVTGLVLRGFGYLLWLALPGVPVLAWHLGLVARRAERRQWLVEVLASGVLALAGPAAMWIGLGRPDPLGWLLWLLLWAQSAVSIDYAYLRLAQRPLRSVPGFAGRLRMGRSPLVLSSLAVLAAAACGLAGLVPPLLFLPHLVQWIEVLRGVSRPAAGVRPAAIGMRQLAVSLLFTVLFVAIWLS